MITVRLPFNVRVQSSSVNDECLVHASHEQGTLARGLRRIVVAVLTTCTPWQLASAGFLPCSEVNHLIEQSESHFVSFLSEEKSASGGVISTLLMSGAQYCEINGSNEQRSHRCVWEYSLGDERATLQYRQLVLDIVECLGSDVIMQKDQAVNHPDSYDSYLFNLYGAKGRIALKDKRALERTFLSFVINSTESMD